MGFETLVRPFTDPRSLGTQRIPVIVVQVPDEDATLTWGVAGDLIQPQEAVPADTGSGGAASGGGGASGGAPSNGGVGFQIQSCNQKSHETDRTTVTQRITNPDDESQFIDVAQPDTIKFKLKPQDDVLKSKFNTTTTTWAETDELYSEISDIVDPPDQQDICQQQFTFVVPQQ